VLINFSCFGARVRGETFTGRAVNLEGRLEYTEHHTVRYRNGGPTQSETVYYDALNQKIGDLKSTYAFGPQFGSYHFRDTRAEYEDGADVSADTIRLFRRMGPERDPEEKLLPREEDQIVGQGFHQFIVQNMEDIVRGEVFHVRLVLPSRLDQFEFRIRKRKMEADRVFIRLEIDNWFLRLFAPDVDVEYNPETRRLLRYEGVSNLEDASGGHKTVVITYTHDPPPSTGDHPAPPAGENPRGHTEDSVHERR